MFLEYFYFDKFVSASGAPWWLVGKDVVSTLLFILPLKKAVCSVRRDYRNLCERWGHAWARCIYVPGIAAQALFSVAMVARLVGMGQQYSTGLIPRPCLKLTEAGRLVQNPFSRECLTAADWVIVGTLPACLLVLAPLLLYTLYSVLVIMAGCKGGK